LIFCAIADAIDSVREVPTIVFWENVPGVLSTKDNAFGCFLAELAGESNELIPTGKKWTNAGVIYGLKRTVAWRVLDAQYFGLAQRRKRVFVVASARKDFDPTSVLFETDGVRLDKPPSRSSFDPRSPDGNSTIGTLLARDYKGIGNQDLLDGRGLCFEPSQNPLSGEHIQSVYEMHAQDARVQDVGNVLPTMSATYGSGGGNIPVTYGIPDANNVGTPIGTDLYNGNITGDIAATMGTPGSSINASGPTLMQHMMVRRLTPIECERLQGFPDDYTRIPWRKKPASVCPDGPRYKAIGNSWAVPVVTWIGERIAKELNRNDVK
jgi:DNA (cytosine-5)-methyltransferase 1